MPMVRLPVRGRAVVPVQAGATSAQVVTAQYYLSARCL